MELIPQKTLPEHHDDKLKQEQQQTKSDHQQALKSDQQYPKADQQQLESDHQQPLKLDEQNALKADEHHELNLGQQRLNPDQLNPDQQRFKADQACQEEQANNNDALQPHYLAIPSAGGEKRSTGGGGWARLSARIEEAVIKNVQPHDQKNWLTLNGQPQQYNDSDGTTINNKNNNCNTTPQNQRMKFKTIAKGLSLMSRVRVAEASMEREQHAFFSKFGISTTDSVQKETASSDLSTTERVFDWDGMPKWAFFRDKFVLDPFKDYYYRWIGIVTLAYCYNLLLIVYRCVFIDSNSVSSACLIVFIFLDIIFDIIYVIDSFVRARTGYLDQGLLVKDVSKIKRHYRKNINTRRADMFSCLPLDYLFQVAFRTTNPCFRFNRLIRIDRAFSFQNATEMRMSKPNYFRLLCVLIYILVLIHWNACFYFFMSHLIGFGSTQWVYGHRNIQSLPPGMKDTLSRRYLYSFYWSTLMLTTIGEVPWPVKSVEFVIVCADLLFGVLIFATTVGNVGTLITTAGAARLDFQTSIDKVKKYLKHRCVGKKLVHRIGKWFDYLWENKQAMAGRNDQEVLQLLPTKLQAEIAMHVHFETLRKVRLFQDCEAGLLGELVLKLELQVFSPNDYVCRKGDVGREMYIVKKGRLQVVADDAVSVLHTLQEGAVFGELSLLNIPGSKQGNRRSASIRSVGYTDLFVLKKADLWAALREYPDAKKLLMQKGCELLLKDGLLDERLAQSLHDESKSEEQQLRNIRAHVDQLQNRLARLTGEYVSTETRLFARLEQLEKELAKYGLKDGE